MLAQVISKHKSKVKREVLCEEVNQILIKDGLKKISFGSLKRYLSELKKMSEEDKKELFENIEYTQNERKRDLSEALESSGENSKKVKMCKKRLKQVGVKIKEEI